MIDLVIVIAFIAVCALPFAFMYGVNFGRRIGIRVEVAQHRHIETLKEIVDAYVLCEDESPDDDPGDGELPGVLQENAETKGNVIPMKKTGTK